MAATAPPAAPPSPFPDGDGPHPAGGTTAPGTPAPARTRRGRSTPALFRLLSLVCLVLCVLTGVAGFAAARTLTTATDRAADSSGPVLVAIQDVVAAIAEADAASASVFLSGVDGDRQQRRLYELALERASTGLERVSRLVGDDDADHATVAAVGADLVRYAGLVEEARLANVVGLNAATERLRDAIDVVQSGMVPGLRSLTESAQVRFDDDVDTGAAPVGLFLLVAAVTVVALVGAQLVLTRRTNRVLNPPLVVATIVVIVAAVWMTSAWVDRDDELDAARDGGYESIALTAEIQTTAFRYKTLESLSLLGRTEGDDAAESDELAARLVAVGFDPADPEAVAAARSGTTRGAGLLPDANRTADSVREQAATAEMLIRWARYVRTSDDIAIALGAGDTATAVELATGSGNTDFNGFNTAVESVLSDNRTQFADGLAAARDQLARTELAMVALAAIAALAALWGFQLRIREYRR